MDLLNLIFDIEKSQNTCCLCFTYSEKNINISSVFEVVDKQFQLCISLKNIIVTTLPQIVSIKDV